MKINELKRIAEENNYELKEEKETEDIILERKVGAGGIFVNVIIVSLKIQNLIFIENKYCDEKDLQMIKATVEFAETPPEDREEDTKDKLLNEINRILNNVKDFDNKGLMEVLNSIEKLEDDLEIFANDLKNVLVEVEE